MFKRKPKTVDAERVIANLTAQKGDIWSQLVAASVEAERRYVALQRDRDEWRRRALAK